LISILTPKNHVSSIKCHEERKFTLKENKQKMNLKITKKQFFGYETYKIITKTNYKFSKKKKIKEKAQL